MKRKRNLRIACLIDDDIVRHIRESRAHSRAASKALPGFGHLPPINVLPAGQAFDRMRPCESHA
jgi:hypothetical protein